VIKLSTYRALGLNRPQLKLNALAETNIFPPRERGRGWDHVTSSTQGSVPLFDLPDHDDSESILRRCHCLSCVVYTPVILRFGGSYGTFALAFGCHLGRLITCSSRLLIMRIALQSKPRLRVCLFFPAKKGCASSSMKVDISPRVFILE
jgi:hypothetical protein